MGVLIATDSVQAWFSAFPYAVAKEEMAGLQADLQKISTRIYVLQEAISLYERHMPEEARAADKARATNGTGDNSVETSPVEPPQQVRQSLRKALLGTFGVDPAREWTTDGLWELLAAQSMVRRDQQGKNNLFATLSNLTKQGQLERLEKGRYRLKVSAPVIPGL